MSDKESHELDTMERPKEEKENSDAKIKMLSEIEMYELDYTEQLKKEEKSGIKVITIADVQVHESDIVKPPKDGKENFSKAITIPDVNVPEKEKENSETKVITIVDVHVHKVDHIESPKDDEQNHGIKVETTADINVHELDLTETLKDEKDTCEAKSKPMSEIGVYDDLIEQTKEEIEYCGTKINTIADVNVQKLEFTAPPEHESENCGAKVKTIVDVQVHELRPAEQSKDEKETCGTKVITMAAVNLHKLDLTAPLKDKKETYGTKVKTMSTIELYDNIVEHLKQGKSEEEHSGVKAKTKSEIEVNYDLIKRRKEEKENYRFKAKSLSKVKVYYDLIEQQKEEKVIRGAKSTMSEIEVSELEIYELDLTKKPKKRESKKTEEDPMRNQEHGSKATRWQKIFGCILFLALFILLLLIFSSPDVNISVNSLKAIKDTLQNFSRNLRLSHNFTSSKSELLVERTPVMVWYTGDFYWVNFDRKVYCENGTKRFECDVIRRNFQPEKADAYIFYAEFISTFPLPRDPKQIWALLEDDSPKNYLMLMYEEALNLFNVSATFGRYSDVPIPLNCMRNLSDLTSKEYFVNTTMKNSYLSDIAPVIYMQSNCDTSVERDAYVQKLMEYIKVDSYGVCLHNKDLPLDKVYSEDTNIFRLYDAEILNFIAKFKFIIAIENSVCNDYVTEKFWRSVAVGVVPIYYGSPLIREWLPNNKSAILLEDFPTPELLSRHLHYLLSNDTAYEEYLEHKTLGVISNQKLIDEVAARPYQIHYETIIQKFECVICERIHNKKIKHLMTRKHYDCLVPPPSALLQSVNPNNTWLQKIKDARMRIDLLYEEIRSPNRKSRSSNVSWWTE